MKHHRLILVLLLLTLMFGLFQCQRGGGGRSSGRSSFSSSRSWGGSRSSSSRNSRPLTWGQILVILGVIGGGVGAYNIYDYFVRGGNSLGNLLKNRKQKIRQITDRFQGQYEGFMCTMSEDQRNHTIDWFMRSPWRVLYKVQNSGYQGQFQFAMKDIVKRTDYVYQIQASGSQNELGNSTLKGILLFQRDYMSICFDKLYDNRNAAGQTGKWDMLVYKGIQQGEIFSGQWYYQGFQNDGSYSGSMRMVRN